jgi:Flp pilus assembly protein TadD
MNEQACAACHQQKDQLWQRLHHNLGLLYAQRQQFADAAAEYRLALRLQPSLAQAYVNLTDMNWLQGKDHDGERMLWEGLAAAPDHADLQHALGLMPVRQQRPRHTIAAAVLPNDAGVHQLLQQLRSGR